MQIPDAVALDASPARGGALDAEQRVVIDWPAAASGVVVGAPGSGKTTTLLARVRELVASGVDPDEILVLTPTRPAATALRDPLALAVGRATSGALARSVASFAFQLVRAAEVRRGLEPPQLLTGGDEDQIIRDLLEGDALDELEGLSRWPAWLGPVIRATRGFRGDLRAFLAECTDLGVVSDDLVHLAERFDLPVWASLASFADEYRAVRSEMRGAHRDAADLAREAVAVLDEARVERGLLGRFSALRCILVDDAQELTAGGIDLLRACRGLGIGVVAFGDPDVGSGAFRGATPENFARLARELGTTAALGEPHRGTPEQIDLVRRVVTRIGAAGVVAHRRAPSGAVPQGSVRTYLLRSPAEEADAIARLLRERHVLDGVPWGSCAVIAHDSRQVATLEAELAAREVPARASGPGLALGVQRPVRDLVGLVELGMKDPDDWAPDEVVDALLGTFGGLDPIELRRLRTALRHDELGAGGARTATELLVSGVRFPLELETVDTREARRAARLGETLAALRAQALSRATPHELLWTAWERSGLSRSWREAVRGHGPIAEQADRDLDAVVALFQAAKRYTEREPDGEASVFLRAVLDSDVAEDRIEQPAVVDTVRVLTPAAAAGTAFDTVIIAGVQDGVWPNTRLRGGLLETWRLADAVQNPDLPAAGMLDRRRAAMHDELRLFVRALSRAGSLLVVTAVDDDDTGPSVLFEMLPAPEPAASIPEHPLSLRGLVARHRRSLTVPRVPATERAHAAGQLALLATAGVAGAAPEEWYGVAAPTSSAPLRDLTREDVRVSPSRLHALEECELDWVIADLGGDRGGTTAGIGTIIHAALETAASSSEDDLWAVVDERWGELAFDAVWRERAERTRARELIRRLAAYLRRFDDAGGRLIGAERHFEVPIPIADAGEHGAVLSGDIDRVEVTPAGEVVIVDLKTGKSEPQTDAKVADNPQLAAYQLAFSSGAIEQVAGLPSGGAKLLVLRPTAAKKDYAEPTQKPFDDAQRAQFVERVQRAVGVMRGTSFAAPYEVHCRDEFSYGLCRIHTVSAVSAS
ncbi:Superfamily I DNA or RNA helicase [Microbacterium testaceum StLB037]|uniref:DNA 3'-5' helicase n=1 Tax=Microbacterium testaceum (strain StLB037) TaxID=979556 RepID=A0A1H0S5Y2_MICTS|nr:ATP-dependent DNA helicase [Microbacterium testaceum]SDP36949.1 Superfamily I DNA or RNA helicase [Microbacterium testaceum StLB037]